MNAQNEKAEIEKRRENGKAAKTSIVKEIKQEERATKRIAKEIGGATGPKEKFETEMFAIEKAIDQHAIEGPANGEKATKVIEGRAKENGQTASAATVNGKQTSSSTTAARGTKRCRLDVRRKR